MSRPGLGFHHRLWWTLGGLASGPLPTLQQSSCVRQPLPVGPHLRKSPPPPPPPALRQVWGTSSRSLSGFR